MPVEWYYSCGLGFKFDASGNKHRSLTKKDFNPAFYWWIIADFWPAMTPGALAAKSML